MKFNKGVKRVLQSTFTLLLLWSLSATSVSATSVSASEKRVSIANLNLNKIEQSWWKPLKNRSVTNEILKVAGVEYREGVGTHSNSTITLSLKGDSKLFTASVGVDDKSNRKIDIKDSKFTALGDGSKLFYYMSGEERNLIGIGNQINSIAPGSVLFRVLGDGKELWSSGLMSQGDAAKECRVDIKGYSKLTLEVTSGGDGESGDHANWIAPTVTYSGDKPEIVFANFQADNSEAKELFNSKIRPQIEELPILDSRLEQKQSVDWLVQEGDLKAGVYRTDDCRDIVLANGLLSRRFRVTPNLATVDMQNCMTGEALLRAVKPEAVVTIDGKKYSVGGLLGQRENGYLLPEWIDGMYSHPNSFLFSSIEVKENTPSLEWKQVRWSLEKQWSATGKHVELLFRGAKGTDVTDVNITVHYVIYDNMPLLKKWIEVENRGAKEIRLNSFVSEVLGVVEYESSVDKRDGEMLPPQSMYVESNYAFGGFDASGANKTTNWVTDKEYTSQVNYGLNTPCLLESKPPIGPDASIAPAKSFVSFDTYELLYDSEDRERNGLAKRRMYRKVVPWVTENPIFMHLTTTDFSKVKEAVDQCAEVGYEMVILSFGSGLNMEDQSEDNFRKFREMVAYAKGKGVELGGYSLLSSRWISDEVDVINPKTGKRGGMIHGSQPCIGSEWGEEYFQKLENFYKQTDMMVFEHDGSYPGNLCASTTHKHHKGVEDSQWYQWSRITKFYKWMRSQGIYVNVPDYYFMSGSSKTGIGYREVNWSLPRAQQLMLGRQNIYDGQWDRLPGMCWTFVPLVEYHGGGEEATLEPLNDHIDDYKAHMMQNYGSGIQACYRGSRLYDTDETKMVVEEVISWYKEHRDILNSEIIHLRRPDGKDYDGIMHINPELEECGMIMLYNPTAKAIEREIEIPIYYTGIESRAIVIGDKGEQKLTLDREYNIRLKVSIPAHGYSNYLVKSDD